MNDLDDEFKTRTIQANRCLYALKHLFRRMLLSNSYCIYNNEVSTLQNIGQYRERNLDYDCKPGLQLFERRIQRSISVPTKVVDTWRIGSNGELVDIFIVSFI